jgi:hypothetical protein
MCSRVRYLVLIFGLRLNRLVKKVNSFWTNRPDFAEAGQPSLVELWLDAASQKLAYATHKKRSYTKFIYK